MVKRSKKVNYKKGNILVSLNKQETPLIGLEFKHDPTVQMVYGIAGEVLDREINSRSASQRLP